MRIILTMLLIFITLTVQAQMVRVFERESNFPVENVTIYNDSKEIIVYTDKHGIADLSVFKNNDVISFNHLSFYEFEILKSELGLIEFVVYLIKKEEQLNEIVLSASKGYEKRSRVAERIVVTSKEEIKRLSPQTSADLLAEIPGVKVQKSQFGGGSPVLRGMEANRVLLVVDGVRMNNAIYRMGHLQNSITISPNILERTEVIFGPSSVVYGSDALGGVVHYYTKTPKVSDQNEINASIYSRYSSVNNERTAQADVELRFNKWASYTNVVFSKFGDLKMGKNRRHEFDNWGKVYRFSDNTNTYYNPNSAINLDPSIQKNTSFNQTDVLQKFAVPISEKTDLSLNFQYSTSSINNRFDKLTELSDGKLKFAEWYYGPQKRLLISPQLKLNLDKKWMENGTITLAYQNIKESRVQRKFSSLNRSYRNENVDVFSLNGDFFVSLSEDHKRILSYGIETTHNIVDSKAIGKTLDVYNNEIVGFTDSFTVQSRYPDGGSTYTSFAAYINYRQDISKKATLNTGLRIINTKLNAKWIDETFITLPDDDIFLNNSALTATVGYVYKPAVNWQLNTVISSGFRSPNIDDIGKIREKSGKVTVPNIYLKPEYAYNFEIGSLKYFNQRKFQAGLTVYYTLLNNYITRDFFEMNNATSLMYDENPAVTVSNVNKGNAYIAGGTISFKGNIYKKLFTSGFLTYTKGRTYDTKEPRSSIPPLFGSLKIGFEKERFTASINGIFNFRKELIDYNLIEGIDNIEQTPIDVSLNDYYGTPSWYTLNANANYRLSNTVAFFINVDNIFDVHYKEFASAISAPGRNLSFAVLINI